MALVKDFVLQTANAPGTATFNLIAPPAGRRSFVAANAAGAAFYVAFDNTSFEEGWGTVTAGSPDTLSRDLVTDNSLNTTAKINFTGTTTIWCDIPAARAIYASPDNLSVPFGGRILSGLAAGVAAGDAPRFDQVGGVRYPTSNFSGGAIFVNLPNGVDLFTIDLIGISGSAAVACEFRISTNNGASYLSGATEYNYANLSAVGATVAATSGAISYAPLGTQNMAVGTLLGGVIELNPAIKTWRSRVQGYNGTNITQEFTSGFWSTAGTPTNILIGPVSGAFTGGQARLVQKVL